MILKNNYNPHHIIKRNIAVQYRVSVSHIAFIYIHMQEICISVRAMPISAYNQKLYMISNLENKVSWSMRQQNYSPESNLPYACFQKNRYKNLRILL